MPGTGQDNNNLMKTGGAQVGWEGGRNDPGPGVKNPPPGLLLPPGNELRRMEDEYRGLALAQGTPYKPSLRKQEARNQEKRQKHLV